MEVVRMLEWIYYTGRILVYSNQLRVMLMFCSGGEFFDMNKLVDFLRDPRFLTQPAHKYCMVFGMDVKTLNNFTTLFAIL
jgi:hypothetical protein